MSKTYQGQGVAAATGQGGTVEADLQPPSGYWWYVTHIAVITSQNNPCIAQAFVDQKYFCGTQVGQADTADGTPLIVNDNQRLRILWFNPGANATCTVNVIVEELLRGYSPR